MFSQLEQDAIAETMEMLHLCLIKWPKVQISLTLLAYARYEEVHTKKILYLQDDPLCLPSSFDTSELYNLNLTEMVKAEGDLWEGAAYDAIALVREVSSALSVIQSTKGKQTSGVKAQTR